jgi:cytochrome c peroxidase
MLFLRFAHTPLAALSKKLSTVVSVAFLGFLGACGGHDVPALSSTQTEQVTVSLTAAAPVGTQRGVVKSATNLLDLAGRWPDWGGAASGIEYDAASGALRIPAPESDLVVGVRRFDHALPAGVSMTLAVDSTHQRAAAVLFLFDDSGHIVDTGSATAGLALARQGEPYRFTVPAGVIGFYLQVQSDWQADNAASLNARLSEDGSSSDEVAADENGGAGSGVTQTGETQTQETQNQASQVGGQSLGNNLINADTDWSDWQGNYVGIAPSESRTQVFLPAATPTMPQAIGVSRVMLPLQAGVEYEFGLDVSAGAQTAPAALLWLINSQTMTVPFESAAGESMNWLRILAGKTARFVVPADIEGFAVQLQSGYRATARALVTPALRRVGQARGNSETGTLGAQLQALLMRSHPDGPAGYLMPLADDIVGIPQDASNPVTMEKIALGAQLFHETALSTVGNDRSLTGTWSCASCHHVAAGFKAGVPQGIGEGGVGFGQAGEGRRMSPSHDALAPDGHPSKPDVQPLASPTILNTAYQPVMLWNGQFGNSPESPINEAVDPSRLMTAGTPKAENARALPGLEIQAVAGLGVHRLNVETDSVLQLNAGYRELFDAAYPSGSTDVLEDAAKAIAAYERSVLANQAPFQRWLQGDDAAMTARELRGALLFFGDAGCVACHQGPALSSEPTAQANDTFFAVGFADFDLADPLIHGAVSPADRLGRGGLTGDAADNYKFKVPQLYNLADTDVMGHGASFTSVRAVVDYKNQAVPQNPAASANLDQRFVPLGLSDSQVDDLTAFLTHGLYDADLQRYVPNALPTGRCFPVADQQARRELGCEQN